MRLLVAHHQWLVIWALILLPAGCDRPVLPLGEDQRSIIGGTPTPESTLPAVGALVLEQYTDKQILCTATVISDRLLLTSAHCAQTWQTLSAQAPYLKLGFWNGSKLTSSSTLTEIASTKTHPDFPGGLPPGSLGDWKDIAVARLAQPTAIPPMKLIRPAEIQALSIGASVLIAGYGLTDPYSKESGGTKNHGTTSIDGLGPAELHVLGDSRPQKCDGDSGGPTILEVQGKAGNEQRLIGVASRSGEGCVGGSVETRVDYHLGWLHSQGTLPCGSGQSPDCTTPPPGKKFGEPCTKSDECEDGLCLAGAEKVCSKACVVGGDTCPAGTRCVAASGSSGQGACMKSEVPPPPAKKKSGETCGADDECESKVCVAGAAGSTCATACDQAGGCGTGMECVSSTSGARYCAPAPVTTPPPPKGGCTFTALPARLDLACLVLAASAMALGARTARRRGKSQRR